MSALQNRLMSIAENHAKYGGAMVGGSFYGSAMAGAGYAGGYFRRNKQTGTWYQKASSKLKKAGQDPYGNIASMDQWLAGPYGAKRRGLTANAPPHGARFVSYQHRPRTAYQQHVSRHYQEARAQAMQQARSRKEVPKITIRLLAQDWAMKQGFQPGTGKLRAAQRRAAGAKYAGQYAMSYIGPAMGQQGMMQGPQMGYAPGNIPQVI